MSPARARTVDFGIQLGTPTAEAMTDRHGYYRELLALADGAFASAWVSDHLMNDDLPLLEGWTVSACAEVGRELSSIRLSAAGEAYFPADPAFFPEPTSGAISPAQDPSGSFADALDWVMGPTPGDAIRQLEPLVELGVSLVTVYFHDRRSLELFRREVVPAFR